MRLWEGPDVECKREYTPEIKKEIVAFANSRGGVLYIGVADDGDILGLPDADEVLLRVSSMMRDAIRPDGEKFEDMRSLNQELSFDFASAEFGKKKLKLGRSQMKSLGILGVDDLYTNLGLLLSEQCPHILKAAVFEGADKTVFKDRREFGGSILQQLAEGYDFLDRYNKTQATYAGLERVDKKDYPEIALREALLNAVVHRDYAFSGSTLLNVFSDKIEIVSIGGLVPGISINDIKLGVSQPRNEKLANIFYRLQLIEAYGTGISKIVSSYAPYGMQPDFRATEGAFAAVLPSVEMAEKVEAMEIAAIKKTAKIVRFDGNSEKILAYIAEHGDISRKDAERLCGVGQTMAGRHLRSLEAAGLIRSVGGGKNVRYEAVGGDE